MIAAPVNFSALVSRLEGALREPLPGSYAQERFAPRPLREWPPAVDSARIRHAAGLLLLFPIDNRAHVVLTVRADTLGRHGGQVSLPGGGVDPGEAFEQAALREAHEEIALALAEVRILGALTPLDIPVSGFRLHPIVAATDTRPMFAPSAREVARILEVPVAELQDPARWVSRDRVRDGRAMTVPAFQIGDVEIWGATAMVLAEFLALQGWRP